MRQFGAKCDGTTDDSSAIQSAINYSGTAGSIPVIIPASSNGCIASVAITAANNIPIVGSGWTTYARGGSKIKAPSLASSALTIGDVGGVSVSNILFLGNSTSAGSYTASVPPLIYLNGSRGGIPSSVTFSNVGASFGYDLIKMNNPSGFRWFGGSLRNYTHTAIWLTGDPRVNGGSYDDYFYGIISDEDDKTWEDQGNLIAAIYSDQNGGSITIDGADILHSHVGFLASPTTGHYVIWPFITNSYFDTCDYYQTTARGAITKTTTGPSSNMPATYVPGAAGIALRPTSGGKVNGAFLSNVWTSTCSIGIDISGSSISPVDTVTINNWQALNNGGATLYATYANNINVINATIAGGGQLAPNSTYAGIEIDAGATNIQIANSRVGSIIQGYGATMKFGLLLDRDFNGRLGVNGLNFVGNFTSAVLFRTTALKNVNIQQSAGFNPQGTKTVIADASPFTYIAGVAPETLYITGGSVSSVSYGNGNICIASPCIVALNPAQAVTITFSATPTLIVNQQ